MKIFSKVNEARLSLQGEQLKVFIATDKIGAPKRKIRSLENWIHYYEIDKYQHLKHLTSPVKSVVIITNVILKNLFHEIG